MATAAIRQRVKQLQAELATIRRDQGKRRRLRYLKGKRTDEAFDIILGAILPESEAVLEDLISQAEEYAKEPPHEWQGVVTPRSTGFIRWVCDVMDGFSALPEPIPHDVLLAYRNGHKRRPGCPVPSAVCMNCMFIGPNAGVNGELPWISPCPVCRGGDIRHILGLHRDPRFGWYFGKAPGGEPTPPEGD